SLLRLAVLMRGQRGCIGCENTPSDSIAKSGAGLRWKAPSKSRSAGRRGEERNQMATVKFVRRGGWMVLIASYAILVGAAQAQELPDAKSVQAAFQERHKRNEKMIRQYSWKSRTEVRVGDEIKSVLLEMARYDANGALQKTPIGGQPPTRG